MKPHIYLSGNVPQINAYPFTGVTGEPFTASQAQLAAAKRILQRISKTKGLEATTAALRNLLATNEEQPN